MAYVRTVTTGSGARAVQIVWKSVRGAREIEHIGSAHTDSEIELLKAAAVQKITAGQDPLPIESPAGLVPGSLRVAGMRMGFLLDAIAGVYRWLGLDKATDGDVVFEQLVTARIIEPSSKQDAARVLDEAGMGSASYPTVKRRLPVYADPKFRRRLSGAVSATASLGPAALVLYDVTTLWFETTSGDGFREPGFSKERRLEPQITVGLLTDVSGVPLMIEAFEGDTGETKTMIPVIRSFVEAHGITDVVVVADAGMMSEKNLKDIEDAGWSFIVGGRIPEVPYAINQWKKTHPGAEPVDQLILRQKQVMGTKNDKRTRTVFFQYRQARAKRTLHGIEQQIAKAEKAVTGQAPIKRNRFITLSGADPAINRALEVKARALAGWKSYVTNVDKPAEFVIGAYHQLWHIEYAFRMSKHDLKARPIYHRKKESIDAHLTIVFAALAVGHRIEQATGWTIKRFVRTFRRYRHVTLTTPSGQTITADPALPADEHDTLTELHKSLAH